MTTNEMSISSPSARRLPWHSLWLALVVVSVFVYAGRDLRYIAAGALSLLADRVQDSAPSRALRLLDDAAWLAPDSSRIYSQRGLILAQQGDHGAAVADFEQALLFDERNAAALNNLAWIRANADEITRAARLADLAAIYAPNNVIVRRNHGLLLFAQGDYVAAARALEEATRLQSSEAVSYLYLALSYLQQGQPAKAEPAARTALLVAGQEPTAYLALLYALYYQNRLPEAIAASDNAAARFPSDVRFPLFKALVLRDMGDLASARAILEPIAATSSDKRIMRMVADILNMVQ